MIITAVEYSIFTIQKEYLVLWEGYSKHEASWVMDEDLTEAATKLVNTAAMDSTEYGLVWLHHLLTTPYSVQFRSYWSSSAWRSTLMNLVDEMYTHIHTHSHTHTHTQIKYSLFSPVFQ